MSTAREGTTAKEAIRQTKPFRSTGQEAVITLLLTAETVRWALHAELSGRGDLTAQQYNVMRILRGAGRKGLPTLEIAERMIERTPGVTRLLDRIERQGWVARDRSTEDRRQVICRITSEGLALLRALDSPIDTLDERMVRSLSAAERRTLIRLLNKVRNDAP
ncbi:MAG: MarR family transcriptional regulator [Planctomycetota bacterium]